MRSRLRSVRRERRSLSQFARSARWGYCKDPKKAAQSAISLAVDVAIETRRKKLGVGSEELTV